MGGEGFPLLPIDSIGHREKIFLRLPVFATMEMDAYGKGKKKAAL